MNFTKSTTTTEWPSVPDAYEIEIKANPKFADINLNSIGNESAFSNNDTLTFQGEANALVCLLLFQLHLFFRLQYFALLQKLEVQLQLFFMTFGNK
jgi:hypothetical protein